MYVSLVQIGYTRSFELERTVTTKLNISQIKQYRSIILWILIMSVSTRKLVLKKSGIKRTSSCPPGFRRPLPEKMPVLRFHTDLQVTYFLFHRFCLEDWNAQSGERGP